MCLKISRCASVIVVLFCCQAFGQKTIYVHPEGSADPNGSYEKPFATILQAFGAASNYDIIILKPGIYNTPGNYNLDPNGLLVTIQSEHPENFDIVSATIIDPNSQGAFLYLENGEDPNFVIAGLTIRNGYNREEFIDTGGAIACTDSNPAIQYCIFQNCISTGQGGAVSFDNSSCIIKNCIFAQNNAWGGGAVYLRQSSVQMVNCTVVGNSANFYGGGLFCEGNSEVTLENCIFRGNQLIAPPNGGHQITAYYGSDLTVSYCDIQGEPNGIDHDEGSDLLWLDGNIDADPNFAVFSPQTPASNWDLHLQSKYGRWDKTSSGWVVDTITSPCIDAGDPNDTDWMNESWPNGKRINMGAYGGTGQAGMFGNKADFDVNGTVELSDMTELLSAWLEEGDMIFNLDNSGRVDIEDFAIFSQNWLWQTE